MPAGRDGMAQLNALHPLWRCKSCDQRDDREEMSREQDRPSVHDGRRKAAAPPSGVTGRRSLAMFDTTYLAGLGDTVAGQSGLDWLQVGARLPLRLVASERIEDTIVLSYVPA